MLPDEEFLLLLKRYYPPDRVGAIRDQMDGAQVSIQEQTMIAQMGGDSPDPATHLLVKHRPGGVSMEKLEIGESLIGRSPACQIAIGDDLSVSRIHCLLTVHTGDRITIRDLRSRNGVVVNGRRITGRRSVIRLGDVINLGATTVTLIRI